MKKISIVLCLLASALASCDLLDGPGHLSGHSRAEEENAGKRIPQQEKEPPQRLDTIIYVSAVSFEEGYDWHLDTLTRSAPRSLVLLENGSLLCSVPAGFGSTASDTPDRHRIENGHLYSYAMHDGKTVVAKDGKEAFRYSPAENIYGLIEADGAIWTLGESPEGGISLRRNGTAVFYDGEGYSFGSPGDPGERLFTKDGKPCFLYFRNEGGAASVTRRCFMVSGTTAAEFVPQKAFVNVMDLRLLDGQPCLAGVAEEGDGAISLLQGGQLFSYAIPGYDRLGSCILLPDGGGGLLMEGVCSTLGGQPATYICDSSGEVLGCMPVKSGSIMAFAGEGRHAVVSSLNGTGRLDLSLDGEVTRIEGKYLLLSRRCGCFAGGGFYLGLNPSAAGEKPFVLTPSGKSIPVDINGFITEVKVILEEKE